MGVHSNENVFTGVIKQGNKLLRVLNTCQNTNELRYHPDNPVHSQLPGKHVPLAFYLNPT